MSCVTYVLFGLVQLFSVEPNQTTAFKMTIALNQHINLLNITALTMVELVAGMLCGSVLVLSLWT